MADVYNVIRGDGVFFEGMTKEQIISAIAEATGKTVEDIDSAFITKLKEINKGNALRLWMGTNAEYNKIEPKEDDVLYYVTDDTFVEDVDNALDGIDGRINANYQEILNLNESVNNQLDLINENLAIINDQLNIDPQRFTIEYSHVKYHDEEVRDEHDRRLRTFTVKRLDSVGKKANVILTVKFDEEGDGVGYQLIDYEHVIKVANEGTFKISNKEYISDPNVKIYDGPWSVAPDDTLIANHFSEIDIVSNGNIDDKAVCATTLEHKSLYSEKLNDGVVISYQFKFTIERIA